MTTRRNTGGFENLLPYPSWESFPDIFKVTDNPDLKDLSIEIDKLLEFYCQEIFGLGNLKSIEKCPDFFLIQLGALTGVSFAHGDSETDKRRRIRNSIKNIWDSGIWEGDNDSYIRDTINNITDWDATIVGRTDVTNLWIENPVYLTPTQQQELDQLDYTNIEVSPGNNQGMLGLWQFYTLSAQGQSGMVLIDLGAPDIALITPDLIKEIQRQLDLMPAFFEVWIGYVDEGSVFIKLAQIGIGGST